jgi:hypothetical protein
VISLAPRAAEIAEALRPIVPNYSPSDEPVVGLLAVVLTRVERATAALERVDEATEGHELSANTNADGAATLQRLRADLHAWVNTARRLANDLGLTPTSRARLGLDLARTGDELRRYLDERYPEHDRA